MGCASSCDIFEKFSTALGWIGKVSYSHIIHVLDDFLFIGPPESEICKQGLKVVRLICESVRISLKEEKSKMAVMQKIFLGIEILDT